MHGRTRILREILQRAWHSARAYEIKCKRLLKNQLAREQRYARAVSRVLFARETPAWFVARFCEMAHEDSYVSTMVNRAHILKRWSSLLRNDPPVHWRDVRSVYMPPGHHATRYGMNDLLQKYEVHAHWLGAVESPDSVRVVFDISEEGLHRLQAVESHALEWVRHISS